MDMEDKRDLTFLILEKPSPEEQVRYSREVLTGAEAVPRDGKARFFLQDSNYIALKRGNTYKIGRSNRSDIQIKDKYISRDHAQLEIKENGKAIYYQDENVTNQGKVIFREGDNWILDEVNSEAMLTEKNEIQLVNGLGWTLKLQ